MTKLEAIRELKKCDHSFLKPETVKKFCKPFKLKPLTYLATDSRYHFKGLALYGINPKTGREFEEGDKTEGQDAHTLACYIADSLTLEYDKMFGIGSQLRSACKSIEKHLLKETL